MDIREIKADALESLARRYEERELSEGGTFSLREIKIELARRNAPSEMPTRALFDFIVRSAKGSSDGLLTYLDCWNEFFPNKPWAGNAPRTLLAKALDGVIGYCANNDLPVVTVCVVQKAKRELSPQAEQEIIEVAKRFGFDVAGHSPRSFCEEQRRLTREFMA